MKQRCAKQALPNGWLLAFYLLLAGAVIAAVIFGNSWMWSNPLIRGPAFLLVVLLVGARMAISAWRSDPDLAWRSRVGSWLWWAVALAVIASTYSGDAVVERGRHLSYSASDALQDWGKSEHKDPAVGDRLQQEVWAREGEVQAARARRELGEAGWTTAVWIAAGLCFVNFVLLILWRRTLFPVRGELIGVSSD